MFSSDAKITKQSKDQVYKMNSGSVFSVPASWKIENTPHGYVKTSAPERDLSIYWLELPLTRSIEKIAADSWKQIYPAFNLKPLQPSSPPAFGGWEQMSQIVYDVPASESRMVISTVRTYKDRAYVCLIDGKMAGFSRRCGEFSQMLESWKPNGFSEINLNAIKTKAWDKHDTQEFENFITDSMQKLKIPGASVAIVSRDGTSIYSKGFGTTQTGSNNSVTVNTPFMIGSITKPFTTLLMSTLVDQKKLSWETPVTQILPNFSVGSPDLTRDLTIADTVSASTGMPGGGLECCFKYNGIKPEDRLLEMKSMKPTTKIGETFQYSNYMVMAGGYAAAHAANPKSNLENAYASAMQENIFDQLKMHRTVLKSEDALKLNPALPHVIDWDGKTAQIDLGLETFAYGLAPAGAIWSTVKDLSRYLVLEMNNGVLDGKRIVSEAAILERRKPRIKFGENSAYGLGIVVSKEQGLQAVGHSGGTFGFSSELFFLPEKDIGMVILTNAGFVHLFLAAARQKFLELTYGAKPRADEMINSILHDREELNKNLHSTIKIDSVPTPWIENLIGEYSSDKLGPAKLSRADNGKYYEIEFKEWKTKIGSQIEKDGKKVVVLMDPPSNTGFRLLVDEDGEKLVLEFGQERYEFSRMKFEKKLRI